MTADGDTLVRAVIVGLSFFGAGVALYLAFAVNLREAVETGDAWPLAYTVNRVCHAIVVLLVAEAVMDQPDLPWTWRLGLYVTCLLGLFVSWVLIGLDHRRRNRRHTDREET